jgi:hypothetical protein
MNLRILNLLNEKYQTEILLHVENINNLISNSVGVAEHPDVVATVEMELGKIASLSDKIEALKWVLPKK